MTARVAGLRRHARAQDGRRKPGEPTLGGELTRLLQRHGIGGLPQRIVVEGGPSGFTVECTTLLITRDTVADSLNMARAAAAQP